MDCRDENNDRNKRNVWNISAGTTGWVGWHADNSTYGLLCCTSGRKLAISGPIYTLFCIFLAFSHNNTPGYMGSSRNDHILADTLGSVGWLYGSSTYWLLCCTSGKRIPISRPIYSLLCIFLAFSWRNTPGYMGCKRKDHILAGTSCRLRWDVGNSTFWLLCGIPYPCNTPRCMRCRSVYHISWELRMICALLLNPILNKRKTKGVTCKSSFRFISTACLFDNTVNSRYCGHSSGAAIWCPYFYIPW